MPSQSSAVRRLKGPASVAHYAKATENGHWKLREDEIWWRDRSELFENHGYQLRPRYRPGWKPSWVGTDLDPFFCEDSIRHSRRQVMDATRLRDGKRVMIKKVPYEPGSHEIRISTLLSSPEHMKDPKNHCVPILDHFPDTVSAPDPDGDPPLMFLVMPLLLPCDDPPFEFDGEAIDFMRQIFEGLEYIHENNIAHRDFAIGNIMMDGDALYPEEFHPDEPFRLRTTLEKISPICRNDVGGVRYYIIDYGLSLSFDHSFIPRIVTGIIAQDPDIPELSSTVPYNPFAVDVFTLGNMVKKNFIMSYSNFGFLVPLIWSMTSWHPQARPSVAEARTSFEALVKHMNGRTLRWPLHHRDEKIARRVLRNCAAIAREAFYVARSMLNRSS